MAWNQQGPGNNDPWGQGNGQKGPPDLDEVLRDLQRKLGGIFGKGSSRSGSGSGGGGGGGAPGRRSRGGIPSVGRTGGLLILILIAIFWLASGFYVVDQSEQGVELRFGEFQEVKPAGLRWHMPYPIESVEVVNIEQIRTVEVGYRTRQAGSQITLVPREALMLTADENIIDIQFAVQYNINDPSKLLFNVSEVPDQVVRQATESAVREIVGRNTMDFAITGGRAEIAQETRDVLQRMLNLYESGITVRAVEMQNAQPPAEVKDAFDDAVRAREDEERLKNEAEAYANDVIPKARGAAARILQESEAYKESVIATSEGEASRFLQVLEEYNRAPGVTRDRLYIEAMEHVLSRSTKLVIDQSSDGNNVMYLPLDQLIKRQQDVAGSYRDGSEDTGVVTQGSSSSGSDGRNFNRTGRD
ncbi:MAG: FtsH protease activity modulator HflK [Acidiferrobacteraceae bacterium]|nr:FtsH protease activity modulator HflK [Acidiferrobacteraceae bacterium]